MGSLHYTDFTIGWICALPVELAAAAEMLEETFPLLPRVEGDTNSYTLGRISGHNVVVACLPSGLMGIGSATAVAMQLKSTFKNIRFGLMVGIAGGVPSAQDDIRLGDVVVSQPTQGKGGVIQHDFGKTHPDRIERTGFLNAPPQIVLTHLATLQSLHLRGREQYPTYLEDLTRRLPKFSRAAAGADILHAGDDNEVIQREPRDDEVPVVHYGAIASGNQVIKSSQARDNLSKDFGKVLCFEMEAAGLMNNFPCLVIRGICDYADAHKQKKWQPYASAAAAAYAKEFLMSFPADEVVSLPPVEAVLSRRMITYNTATFGDNNSGIQMGNSSGPITMTVNRR